MPAAAVRPANVAVAVGEMWPDAVPTADCSLRFATGIIDPGYNQSPGDHGLGPGVGRGLGVGPDRGVGVGLGVAWRSARRSRRSSRGWRRATGWRYTNEIDVLLVLSSAGVEVVGGRVGDVASGVIRDNGDVIAYLVLMRPAFQRVKRIADSYVRRPGNTAIGAIGVEQLRVDVIRGISRIQPHRINPAIRRDADCAEPMPLVRIHRIVVDPMRRAKRCAAVSAAREHHVRSIAAEGLTLATM